MAIEITTANSATRAAIVGALDAKLALTTSIYNPLVVAIKNVSVVTSGAPLDVATISLPAWLTKYTLAPSGSRCVPVTFSATMAGASFLVSDAANNADASKNINTSFLGPATATGQVNVIGSSSVPITGGTLYVRQTANSANAGTISIYLLILPCL